MRCWSEYSRTEIMSMYGVELEDKCEELEEEDFSPETYEEEEEPLTLESLGMSWRDFF